MSDNRIRGSEPVVAENEPASLDRFGICSAGVAPERTPLRRRVRARLYRQRAAGVLLLGGKSCDSASSRPAI